MTNNRVAVCMMLSLISVVFASSRGNAQDVTNATNTGYPENAIIHGTQIESVQITNGDLHVQIPIWSVKGRGLDTGGMLIYDNKEWSFINQCYTSGICVDRVGGEPGNNMVLTARGSGEYSLSYKGSTVSCGGPTTFITVNVVLREPNGTKHHFVPDPVAYAGENPCGNAVASALYANDGSGWMVKLDSLANPLYAVSKNGTTIPYSSGSYEDANGNQIASSTDTLGRPTSANALTYVDSSGVQRSATISSTTSVTVATGMCIFSTADQCTEANSTWTVPSVVTLPNGMQYSFGYAQNQGAEITSITLPTGGQISYTYGAWQMGGRTVATRTETSNGVTGMWTYTISGVNTTVTDPNSNDTTYDCSAAIFDSPCFTQNVKYYTGSQTAGTLLKTEHTDYSSIVIGSLISNYITVPIRVTTTWNQTNQVRKTETDWDTANVAGGTTTWKNVLEKREYDFGPGAPPTTPTRRTHYNYLHLQNATYLNANIADRPTSKVVYDGASNVMAQTTYTYDGSTVQGTSGVPGHDYTKYSSANNIRGNLTQTSRWLNTNSTWLNTINTHNDLGDLLSTTDPLNNTTNFSYTDNFTDGVNRNAQAFVTQTTYPATSGVSHIEWKQYYWNTSLAAASCGQNFPAASACTNAASIPQPDYMSYTYDLMNRALNVTRGNGGQTNFSYNDTAQPLSISSTQSINGGSSLANTTLLDGMGRSKQSQLTSDPQGTIFTDTSYNAFGRVATVSNPYRSTGESTYGITTYKYDALGRVCVVVPPDGTAVSGNTCPATQPTNDVFTTYSGNTATVTDQAGKSRKSVADGLGRLTQVFEDPANLNYETDYNYDTLDNLLTVNQKGGSTNSANWRTRTFTYDSLSRLLTAANPESGTISYTYDNSSNLLTKVAPAPNQTGSATVTTTFTYDQLNRLTQKSFSDGTTPTVKYGYDAVAPSGCTPPALTITNGIGRRTSMCDAAGAEAWSFDTMGRPLADQRTTNGVTKPTTYAYNLDGSIATLTYPSGRSITYTLASSGSNTAGRISSAVDSTGPINYATGALYSPAGALSSFTNDASIVSTYFYNDRLQPCRISVKNTGTAPASCTDAATGNVLDFSYNFSLGATDNGNVTAITNNRDTTRSQSFTYDPINRIGTAQTTSTTGTTCWDEAFGYDPWGNLLSIGRISGYTCSNEELLSVTATTTNQISGDTFDAAGNLITIPAIANYTYDAENHLKTAAGVTYTYDGDGKRVQKSSGKLYWYGMGSDPLDETDLTGSTTNSSFNEYIFFGGKRIARRDYLNNVTYYFADHLGTARIVANSSGTLLDDSDFYPFGGERVVISSSGNPYKFTGKERDNESGLDEFGARYYSSALGRFTIPDWAANATAVPYADFGNPQSLNLYSYVKNNPLSTTDPDGHCPDGVDCSGNYAANQPPTFSQVGQFLVGVGKELVNIVTSTANSLLLSEGGGAVPSGLEIPQMQGSNFIQEAGMGATQATVVVTGAVETGSAAVDAVAGRLAGAARTAESVGSTAVKEGIYEGADAAAPGRTYVGQSGNVPERLAQHEASGKFPAGTSVSTTEVKGGKTAREIAEQKRIDQLGGVRSKPGSQTSNQRNPIGPKRKDLVNNR